MASTVVQTSTGRSAPKRKAFADACSGIQSALTEQETHENVDTKYEEGFSVARTDIVEENDTLPDENVDDLVSVDDGEKDDVSFGDENSPLGKENIKEESGCANIPPEPKGNADTMEKPKKTLVRPKKNAKIWTLCRRASFGSVRFMFHLPVYWCMVPKHYCWKDPKSSDSAKC